VEARPLNDPFSLSTHCLASARRPCDASTKAPVVRTRWQWHLPSSVALNCRLVRQGVGIRGGGRLPTKTWLRANSAITT
jgi:hypothetical protein